MAREIGQKSTDRLTNATLLNASSIPHFVNGKKGMKGVVVDGGEEGEILLVISARVNLSSIWETVRP